MHGLAWIATSILFLPFFSFVINPLIPESKRSVAGWVACLSLFAALILSLSLFWPYLQAGRLEAAHYHIDWILLPQLKLELGLTIDRLSVLMLLVVTGVGSAIFYYSLEYMRHDEGYKRYFAGLSVFAFSMIGIVLSSNLLQLFIFWELVGLSSYLLIGHWYQKPEAADAAKKAFLTNRVGDFGFLLGILLLWSFTGPLGERTLSLVRLNELLPLFAQSSHANQLGMTIAMLLIFMGVLGKSAQFPLHVWLPDAMEGPTPVSALIHAATMVAAGVYLLARLFPLFQLSPEALRLIAYVGGFTAIFAATHALVQNDMKRILAYSTLSQLGYMVMAIGLGGAAIGMFHLTTHAFFKALLFLAAGSVIHAAHEQDIFKLGGLLKKMPVTSVCFLIGSYALIGFWPASGFFSKDQILALAWEHNRFLFWIATATVFLTAFYMGRLISVSFLSSSPLNKEGGKTKEYHEPGHQIILPLIFLALFSLGAGFLGIDSFISGEAGPHEADRIVPLLALAMGILGVLCAFVFYQVRAETRKKIQDSFRFFYELLRRKYYVDDLYNLILRYIQQPFAELCSWFEKQIIVRGMVNRSAFGTAKIGDYIRKVETGNVQTYLTVFLAGVVILIYCYAKR